MSGGGGSKQSYVPQQPVYRPVNAPEIPTTGYGGMGYYSVPNPFVQGAKPAWMQGYFDMPSWGLDAVTQQPLTQAQLQVQQPPPPAPAPVPAPQQQQAPVDVQSMYRLFSDQRDWDATQSDAALRQQDGIGPSFAPSPYSFRHSPMAEYERGEIMKSLKAGKIDSQTAGALLMSAGSSGR
jgi:hypothetical protein